MEDAEHPRRSIARSGPEEPAGGHLGSTGVPPRSRRGGRQPEEHLRDTIVEVAAPDTPAARLRPCMRLSSSESKRRDVEVGAPSLYDFEPER